jgi:uncharacterized protein YrrD
MANSVVQVNRVWNYNCCNTNWNHWKFGTHDCPLGRVNDVYSAKEKGEIDACENVLGVVLAQEQNRVIFLLVS